MRPSAKLFLAELAGLVIVSLIIGGSAVVVAILLRLAGFAL
jgi:hypothetical protein